jgi:hypothetical protein
MKKKWPLGDVLAMEIITKGVNFKKLAQVLDSEFNPATAKVPCLN